MNVRTLVLETLHYDFKTAFDRETVASTVLATAASGIAVRTPRTGFHFFRYQRDGRVQPSTSNCRPDAVTDTGAK